MRDRLHRQLAQNTCGVAAVRTVLHLQFGVHLGEDVLEALGTVAHVPIREHGSRTDDFRRMIHNASRAFNTHRRWGFRVSRRGSRAWLRAELLAGRYPICQVLGAHSDWQRQDAACYHVVVVVKITDRYVRAFDPAENRVVRLSWSDFQRWWTDDYQVVPWYGVITGGKLEAR